MNDFKNKIQRQRALEITLAMCNSYVKFKSIQIIWIELLLQSLSKKEINPVRTLTSYLGSLIVSRVKPFYEILK